MNNDENAMRALECAKYMQQIIGDIVISYRELSLTHEQHAAIIASLQRSAQVDYDAYDIEHNGTRVLWRNKYCSVLKEWNLADAELRALKAQVDGLVKALEWAKYRVDLRAWQIETMTDTYVETPIDKALQKFSATEI